MKTLTLLVLLVTSQFTHAVTASELDCVARSTYHEARSLPKQDWLKVANVILNRSNSYYRYHYGSRSRNLCDIVKSPQFTSNKKLLLPIRELDVLKAIRLILSTGNWKTLTNALYFETKNGRMFYNAKWSK